MAAAVSAVSAVSAAANASATTLRVCALGDAARIPARASAQAAGYDLSSAADVVVPARGRVLVPLQIALAVPSGHYARIAPRSGLACRGIDVGAGVVDEDYRGEVRVLLINGTDADFAVSRGDRVAQLVLERISTVPVEVVDTVSELSCTARGARGFGSTGVHGDAALFGTDNDCWMSQLV